MSAHIITFFCPQGSILATPLCTTGGSCDSRLVMMPLFDRFKPVLRLFQPRERRVTIDREWGHVEYRELEGEELTTFINQVHEASRGLDRLRWVEVNPFLRRVTFSFPPDSYTKSQLAKVVDQAEVATRLDMLPFAENADQHPGDEEPVLKLMVELGGDTVGLALGLLLGALPVSPSRWAGTATPFLAFTRDVPRLRRRLDERLGRERATLILNLCLALANGLSQRSLASLVELTHKATTLREAVSRRRAWKEREDELCAAPSSPITHTDDPPQRPIPLPKGPIEEYSDRAWFISLGGFAISILTTGSMQRAAAALFGALPKPARLGRDVFTSELSYHLANRGIVVLHPDRLRLLDRIDCLVVQGDLISSHKFMLGRVVWGDEISEKEARQRVRELFDPEIPLALRRRDEWTLAPPEILEVDAVPELESTSKALALRGEIVVGLARDGKLTALAEVKVVPQTGVEELISAAHDAEMRVVVASADESALEELLVEDVIPEREGIHNGIRRLQREGRVVCLVASGSSPGLPIADLSIGLTRLGEPPPWGADVICRNRLSDVRFILQSCSVARSVSKQSVNVALGAATMGAIVSAGGLVPMTTRRAMSLVNAATLISMLNGARSSAKITRKALPPPRDPTPWHALSAQGSIARLNSSEQGLTRREAQLRREADEKAPSVVAQLAEAITDELFNPFTPLLAAGAGLSALVGSTADAGVVAGVVGLNAIIGGIQRFRTERRIRHLATETRRKALVRRDDKLTELPASALVPGDIVLLSPGDVVPADCRLINAQSLEVDASSLTGESMPVTKSTAPSFEEQIADRASMLFEGTSIAAGRATALVVAVGQRTEAQRGAHGAKGDQAQGGVERRLKSLMALTGPVALAAGVGVVGGGLLRGRMLEDLVGSGVSLAVSSVPEGLPLLATAAQLAAAGRLSRRGVLVRNVRSIEALGRVDVICLDKTGTVTEGRIELRSVSDGVSEQRLDVIDEAGHVILAAGLRATAEGQTPGVHGDPTDEALRTASASIGVDVKLGCAGWERMNELPFEAGRGYHAVTANTSFGELLGVKGAPEAILPHCTRWRRQDGESPIDTTTQRLLAEEASRLGRSGLRVLAVADCAFDADESIDLGHLPELTFQGFLAFSDPVRPSAALAIQGLRRAGVSVVMLTGDHPSTATAIATELGLGEHAPVLTGADISRLSNEELEEELKDVNVIARVTPSQKVRVVRSFQRSGRVVAMAGDGANDAPAIRLANVGIAIGERSTAAARGAADVVLTDERIEALVEAIVEGRAMWSSVRDAVSVLVGGNLGEIGFTLAAGLIDGRPPLNARQLLLVNLLTDAAPSMAIALRPPTEATFDELANEGPEASLGRPLNRDITSRAAVTALGAGSAWALGRLFGDRTDAMTMGLVAVIGTQLGQTLVSGGTNLPVLLTGVGSAAVMAAIVQTPGVSHFFGCQPLGPLAWVGAVGASAAATYLSVALPGSFEQFADRFHHALARAPLVDETALEGVAAPREQLEP